MRTFYRYLRDNAGRPIVTLCTVEFVNKTDNSVVFCRGIAICSPRDIKPQPDGRPAMFSKKNGNRIARVRANKAYIAQESFKRIRRPGYTIAKETLLEVMFLGERHLYKAGYGVRLDAEESEYFNVLVLTKRVKPLPPLPRIFKPRDVRPLPLNIFIYP